MKINIAQLAKNSKPLRDLLVPWSVLKKQSTAIYKQNSQSIIHMINLTMIPKVLSLNVTFLAA
jgi:hypothetical protein